MFTWIVKKFKAMGSINPSTTFKIAGVQGSPQTKDVKIIYQVSGKTTIVTEKPQTLLKELMYLRGFSKYDSDLIYDLAISEKLSYSFRILSIAFEEETTKFEIEDIHTKYTLALTASEIISSNKILERFSTKDIGMIYFQLLKEVEQEQQNIKNKLQKTQIAANNNIYVLKTIG